MAEVIGLAASIASLAVLAHTSLKFFKETKHIVSEMKYLDEETNRSMLRISFASGAIEVSQITLSEYCATARTGSPSKVIQFVEDHQAATFLATEPKAISLLVNRLQ